MAKKSVSRTRTNPRRKPKSTPATLQGASSCNSRGVDRHDYDEIPHPGDVGYLGYRSEMESVDPALMAKAQRRIFTHDRDSMDVFIAGYLAGERRYGYLPDLADFRDLTFESSAAVHLPPSVDLRRAGMPSVYDQGQLGSCTANALCNAFRFAMMNQHRIPRSTMPPAAAFAPSRLFLYYQERKIEGTIDTDSGAMIRDGAKALRNIGVCAEDSYPYIAAHFAAKPGAKAVAEAGKHESISYLRVDLTHTAMHSCLAQGFPFVVGFTVYESFESDEVARTGIVPMPSKRESTLGGHAVLVCGYDDEAKTYLVQNSWGESWGMRGYFTIPQAYLQNPNLASDAWTIRSVER